jgi:DinB superfamily
MRIANPLRAGALLTLSMLALQGKDSAPSARQVFDSQLTVVEHDVMSVAEAMPAEKFRFAPRDGAFRTARTFGVQARHIGFCLNEVAVALLGEPMLPHPDQDGPRNVTSKDDVIRYLKEAFAHAHRALGTLTNDNLLEPIADPYVATLRTNRLNAATIFLSHTWDHYGQMVEYLRMNNLAPPGHQ